MPITIFWNGHFTCRRRLRRFAAYRIIRHYYLRGLAMIQPEICGVRVRCVFLLHFRVVLASPHAGVVGTEKVGMIGGDAVISRWISRCGTVYTIKLIMFTRATMRTSISDIGGGEQTCAGAFSFLDCSLLIQHAPNRWMGHIDHVP